MDVSKFEKKINVKFKDQALLQQAFVHRSYINENKNFKLTHNERLEFLGDAVLELVVTEHLFKKYPDKSEGNLTSYRSALVNAITLSKVAAELEMGEYLLLSKGEAKDSGRARQYILANTFEAFVGALYLDQGYEESKKFIVQNLLDKEENEIVSKNLWRDSKSLLQEKAQEYINITPAYKLLSDVGPDHNKIFTVGIFFENDLIAEGKGHSKQEGEQEAARRALEIKHWL
ncbi:MAG: ribonuclease III [Candidatus Vogelbacteria bacterium]|nr:ribonuclease III [Candidatus Vogelbacteria bacterium]